jgi:dipeptidyl aminopeptidase/acylaminoacyl peptidase
MRALSCRLTILLVLVSLGPDSSPARAQDPAPVSITEWLVIGPLRTPLPAFQDEKPGGYGIDDLLADPTFAKDGPLPNEGGAESGFDGAPLLWQKRAVGSDGKVALAATASPAAPETVWLATYLLAERFQSLTLKVGGSQPRGVWLDGASVATGGTAKKGTAEEDGGQGEEKNDAASADVEGKLDLIPGKHLLIVKTVLDPDSDEKEWWVTAALEPGEGESIAGITITTDPDRPMNLRDVLDPPRVTSFATSPNGDSVAAVLRRIVPGTDEEETWVEVRATDSGKIHFTWRGFEMSDVAWSPDGDNISYLTRQTEDDKKLGSLWMVSFKSGRVTPLLQRVEGLERYLWSPAGDEIVYSVKVESKPDERGIKRVEGLLDRQADHRDRSQLYAVSVPGGTRRRLTAGSVTAAAQDVSPDGTRLLFTRTFDDVSQRPYVRTELWEIDLTTSAAKKLRDTRFMVSARYAPDGARVLVLAGPSEFGDVGKNLPAGVVPNEYDGELYVWNPGTDAVQALTVDFDPSVERAAWSRKDGDIYLLAAEQDFVRLYRCDPDAKKLTRIPARFEAVEDLDLALDANVAVVTGTSPWLPQGMARVELKHDQANLIFWPAGDWYDRTWRGTTETWTFTSAAGTKIDGRVYLPPSFDASRKYPMIVYYYGGTAPTQRDFGGRYPKEYWASMGYVVYVLQPSGATGYGQAFSAAHVNDWGATVSDEIIDGVKKFLDSHPYVDPKRVGCIGASFGGFTTMTLVTKTDMFAAAVAHAGISSIASYWGEGYWGYSYSAYATADSFPWNRPDIYGERSPLANADKVKTPILLTHGVSDTNVPVGESDTFFTALKLAGAPVEYVQIEGQDHTILDHEKRIVWSDTIMAWFARWLRDQSEWWEHLYPEPK